MCLQLKGAPAGTCLVPMSLLSMGTFKFLVGHVHPCLREGQWQSRVSHHLLPASLQFLLRDSCTWRA